MKIGTYTFTDTGLVRVPIPVDTGSVDTTWINSLPRSVLTDDLLTVIRNNPRHFHHHKVPKCYTQRMSLLVERLVELNKINTQKAPIPFEIPEHVPSDPWDPFDINCGEGDYITNGSDPLELDLLDFDF